MEEYQQKQSTGKWPYDLATYFTREAKELGSVEAAAIAQYLRRLIESKTIDGSTEVLYPVEVAKIASACGMTNDRVVDGIKVLLNSGVNYPISDLSDKFVIVDWRDDEQDEQ